ncbi:MAG TPA: hypothetical protein VFP84_16065 [Kofleriaceae bacterium]|nr:hypothetical protein [Kofleriaceae bacterium]
MVASIAVVLAAAAAPLACTNDLGAPSEDTASHALGSDIGSGSGSGSGSDIGSGSGSGSGSDTGSGSGSGIDPGGGGDPGGGTGGGGGTTDPNQPHVPNDIIGGYITLVYEGHAHYTIPAWSSLPEVHVVDQLMFASYNQPDVNGPVIAQGVTIYLHVADDPVVDTYVFSFGPGTPGSSFAFLSDSGYWYSKSGGAPSEAGPPFTGRPELIMNQAFTTSWTVLSEWSVPALNTAHGWPDAAQLQTPAQVDARGGAAVPASAAGLVVRPNVNLPITSLEAVAAGVTLIYGGVALAGAGGPMCAPATLGCGGSVLATTAAFVAAYRAMQGQFNGQAVLIAAGGTGAAVIAAWRAQLQTVLAVLRVGVLGCSAAATTCGAEAARFCALSQGVPGNAVICAQDTRLTQLNSGAVLYQILIFVLGSTDTLFRAFGAGNGN